MVGLNAGCFLLAEDLLNQTASLLDFGSNIRIVYPLNNTKKINLFWFNLSEVKNLNYIYNFTQFIDLVR